MKSQTNLLAGCGKLASLTLVSLAFSAPAFASYDVDCMARLMRKRAQYEVDAFTRAKDQWKEPIARAWGVSRKISDLEFEAFQDLLHGLPFTATFRDGWTETFDATPNSIREFIQTLKRVTLIEVEYTTQALATLSELYKIACISIGREDCHRYTEYSGWKSESPRGFSENEEQALKWSTIYMAPSSQMVQRYLVIGSAVEVTRYHARLLTQKQILAMHLLTATFGEREGAIMYTNFVEGYLSTAFEKVYRAYRGERTN